MFLTFEQSSLYVDFHSKTWSFGVPEESLGNLMGEFERSLDAFIIVAFVCFIIGSLAALHWPNGHRIAERCPRKLHRRSGCWGFIYIVLLRFLIGPCVWHLVRELFLSESFFVAASGCWWPLAWLYNMQSQRHGISWMLAQLVLQHYYICTGVLSYWCSCRWSWVVLLATLRASNVLVRSST